MGRHFFRGNDVSVTSTVRLCLEVKSGVSLLFVGGVHSQQLSPVSFLVPKMEVKRYYSTTGGGDRGRCHHGFSGCFGLSNLLYFRVWYYTFISPKITFSKEYGSRSL